jgi:hypothetical protein
MSMIEYDDRGTVVSREDTETTELHSLLQGSFQILEALSFTEWIVCSHLIVVILSVL